MKGIEYIFRGRSKGLQITHIKFCNLYIYNSCPKKLFFWSQGLKEIIYIYNLPLLQIHIIFLYKPF